LNRTRFNIGNHEFESRRLLSIVQRSCVDSDKPGERCELLQVTVNGTNKEISDLEGSRLQFVVFGARPLRPEAELGEITLRIVGKYQLHQIHDIVYLLGYHIGTVSGYDPPKKKGFSPWPFIFQRGCVQVLCVYIRILVVDLSSYAQRQ
jgi:uncharacterized membrane protein YhdT